jgi:hypothetical protein
MDLFAGAPYAVELEKNLPVKQQFLEVVILRCGDGALSERLPDGLDIVVLNEVAEAEHNAPLHLFSAVAERVDWGADHYRGHTPEIAAVKRLFAREQHAVGAVDGAPGAWSRDHSA